MDMMDICGLIQKTCHWASLELLRRLLYPTQQHTSVVQKSKNKFYLSFAYIVWRHWMCSPVTYYNMVRTPRAPTPPLAALSLRICWMQMSCPIWQNHPWRYSTWHTWLEACVRLKHEKMGMSPSLSLVTMLPCGPEFIWSPQCARNTDISWIHPQQHRQNK